jgi:vacuolar protein sorting-associated protein 13A/C
MLATILEKIVNRILGDYVEEFSSDNLHIGIWEGKFLIVNVKLKKNALNKLSLPLNISHSKLGCIQIKIPWGNLGSSKIEIELEGIDLIVHEIPKSMWEEQNDQTIEWAQQQIHSFCNAIIEDFEKRAVPSNGKHELGYCQAIIDNIQVVVTNVHIRFEDKANNGFAFGVTLEKLKISTVNKNR